MGFLVYLICGFITFFVLYKKYWHILLERKREKHYGDLVDFKEFWIVVIPPFIWFLAIPAYFLWAILEKIYKLFNKQ